MNIHLVKCEFCNTEIGYLPYKCKYCSLTFCKKHRLPENHDCSFMLKSKLVVPTSSSDSTPIYREGVVEISTKKYKRDKKTKKFEKKLYLSQHSKRVRFYFTNYLLFTILGITLAALITPQIICLSWYQLLLFPKYYWIVLTSLFAATSTIITFGFYFIPNFFDFIVFMIVGILFYRIFKSVELYHGKKFLFITFIFSTFITGVFAIAYRIALEVNYPVDYKTIICYGFAIGGLYGIISFFVFNSESEYIELIGDLKVNKNLILLFLVILRIFPWLVAGILYYAGFLLFIPDLAGIIAGYVLYLIKRERKIIKL